MLRIPVEKSEFHRETAAGKPLTVGEIRVHPAVNIRHQLSDTVSKRPKSRAVKQKPISGIQLNDYPSNLSMLMIGETRC